MWLLVNTAIIIAISRWSGWTTAIEEVGIATSGTTESLCLPLLMKKAYEASDESRSFDAECEDQEPQFLRWNMVFRLEIIILGVILSISVGDFIGCLASLNALMSYFLARSSTHYTRWPSVNINDMLKMPEADPFDLEEFAGEKQFSSIRVGQAHEQNNSLIKGNGGTVFIMKNESALLRWMVSGSEICGLRGEYDELSKSKRGTHSCPKDIPGR
uniref:Uncharacterized protein n=1 Tax=Octopus bimaculoides TaxID=37653 RepID=A0A0L8HF74_OCTBM